MARLNIAEKRLPQDGRIKLRVSGREIDVRVSVIPMIHGEGIVMRILDKGSLKFELAALGMGSRTYKMFRELIDMPHGIILVTGPTGSGKTTTLYSALQEIRSPEIKIITTEDPVEYQLEGINQIQVHHQIGMTFAKSLRAILRHDPDVVLIGEIRDLETAENAIQASLTGHLVFSTLHTNDAAGSYTRLVDMGVEPFLVASTLEAVMAQRLVRVLCPECREAYRPNRDDLPSDFPWEQLEASGGHLHRPRGCRACRQVGYRGRLGIYELLVSSQKVRTIARAAGMFAKLPSKTAWKRSARTAGTRPSTAARRWTKCSASPRAIDCSPLARAFISRSDGKRQHTRKELDSTKQLRKIRFRNIRTPRRPTPPASTPCPASPTQPETSKENA